MNGMMYRNTQAKIEWTNYRLSTSNWRCLALHSHLSMLL